jgi:hypothetical protein
MARSWGSGSGYLPSINLPGRYPARRVSFSDATAGRTYFASLKISTAAQIMDATAGRTYFASLKISTAAQIMTAHAASDAPAMTRREARGESGFSRFSLVSQGTTSAGLRRGWSKAAIVIRCKFVHVIW